MNCPDSFPELKLRVTQQLNLLKLALRLPYQVCIIHSGQDVRWCWVTVTWATAFHSLCTLSPCCKLSWSQIRCSPEWAVILSLHSPILYLSMKHTLKGDCNSALTLQPVIMCIRCSRCYNSEHNAVNILVFSFLYSRSHWVPLLSVKKRNLWIPWAQTHQNWRV